MRITRTGAANAVFVLKADSSLSDDSSTAELDELGEKIAETGAQLVVDCSGLGYVASFGVGSLVRLHQRLASHGSRLRMAAVAPAVVDVLRLSTLDQIFELHPDLESAQAAAEQG